MRHRQNSSKLGRDESHRKALVRNQITSLVLHEKIETTQTKAKTIQPKFEKMISFVLKHEPKSAKERVNEIVYTEEASKKVMTELKERFKDRTSGFTRVKKTHERSGDNAPMVTIELV